MKHKQVYPGKQGKRKQTERLSPKSRYRLACWVLFSIWTTVLVLIGILVYFDPNPARVMQIWEDIWPSVFPLVTLIVGFYFGTQYSSDWSLTLFFVTTTTSRWFQHCYHQSTVFWIFIFQSTGQFLKILVHPFLHRHYVLIGYHISPFI